MGWTVRTDSTVLVVPGNNPQPGEVWAFCNASGRVVIHRYRRHVATGHVFQGDTCVHPDRPVDELHMIGRVVAVRRRDRQRPLPRGHRLLGAVQRTPRIVVARAAGVLRGHA
jgi:hypothetical protein